MPRVAIIAAMPGELKPLVRDWPSSTRGNIHFWAKRSEEEEWIAACAGAGQAAATRAFAAIEDGGPIDLVFSVGWAGALAVDIATGAAYNVAGVLDVRTGERFEAANSHPGGKDKDVARVGHPGLWLVTSPIVADETEKQRLASAYRADLVDMEAAAIARLARMRGIPFYAIKGVSDGFNDKLPDFNRFIRPDGQFDLTRMVLFAILRPWHWPSLMRMGENSKKASQSIRDSLLDFLDERAQIK